MKLTNHVYGTETAPPEWKHRNPFAPVVFTFIGVLAWLVFILVYALFWSRGFSFFQNVIVTIVSLAIAALLLGLMWVIWGTTHYRSVHWVYPT